MEKEKELFDKIQAEIKENVKEIKSEIEKDLMSKDAFEKNVSDLNEKMETLKENFAEKNIAQDLQVQIDKFNEKMEALKTVNKSAETITDTILAKADDLKKVYREKGKGAFQFEVKTAIDMGLTTAITGTIPAADREAGISYEPKRTPRLLDVIGSGTTNSNTIEWVEKETEAGTPAFKAEFETFPSRSWKSKVVSLAVKKVTVMAEYSRDILEDVPYFQSEMRRDLVEAIQLVLEQNILDGDETSDDLKGILEYAEAWDNGTFTVDDPNIYDVIAVGVNQIREEHHNPSVIVMRPATAMAMKLKKDENNNYVMPPFSAANGTSVEGIPVITTTNPGIDASGILIMDATKAQLIWNRNWSLEISDSHDTNFAKELIAVRLSGRAVLKVKNTDAKAFVYTNDYTAAITSMTASS